MTDPAYAVSTESFDNSLWPHDVAFKLVSAVLDNAPVFAAFTRQPTSRGSMAFPTAAPDGFSWVAELGVIPGIDMHSDAAIAVVAKLAGNVLISNEAVDDADVNLVRLVTGQVSKAMVAKLDIDIVYGAASPGPAGVFGSLTGVTGTTLREGVINAAAAIWQGGGTPNRLLVSTALWAAEMNRRDAGGNAVSAGDPYGDLGLQTIVAPSLAATDALVIDSTGCYGIVRRDVQVASTPFTQNAWSRDGVDTRVIARVAAAIPDPAASARKVTVTP